MSEFRKFSATRTLVKMDDISPLYGDYVIVCVPYDALYVARKLLSERGSWNTSFVRDYVNSDGYNIPNVGDDDFVRYLSSVASFLEAKDMTCDLLDGLNGIKDALLSISSNCYTCGSTTFDGVRYGSGVNLTSDDGLSAFNGSQNDYDVNRCNNANSIVSGLILSLNNLSTLTIVNLLGLGAGIGALFAFGLAVPPVGIIAGLFAALGAGLGVLSGVANWIDNNRGEIVCALYNSEDANSAYDALQAFVEDATIDLGYIEIEIGAIAQLVGMMVPTDTMNSLFSAVGLPAYDDFVPCNSCVNQCNVGVLWGTLVDLGGGQYTVQTYNSGGNGWTFYVRFTDDSGICAKNISSVSLDFGGRTLPGIGQYPYWQIDKNDGTGQQYLSDSEFLSALVNEESVRGFSLSYNSADAKLRFTVG